MALTYGQISSTAITTIPTSGLLMHLDASNTSSYPGTGTTWTDLTGNGYNCTFTGTTPTYAGNVLDLAGTATVGRVNNLLLTSSNHTIVAVARYSGATRGRVVNAINNNWLIGHWGETTENYYAEGWVSREDAGPSDTNWKVLVATGNFVSDIWGLWVNNGERIMQFPAAGTAGPNGISVGAQSGTINIEPSICQVAVILAYNRVLTNKEIGIISNFYMSKFGAA